ncbi:hypothetical protein KUTeg_007610 [Tegillarca granosa]|uniref:Malonyl-CoA decarboxylase n=1 Tax=Tegillarca granosa TaxID=220873 RepID=A0ABQ9FGR8_TEGGR|nr:hypothetical protein KUTeg_007610 [Tegillarca granosa]
MEKYFFRFNVNFLLNMCMKHLLASPNIRKHFHVHSRMMNGGPEPPLDRIMHFLESIFTSTDVSVLSSESKCKQFCNFYSHLPEEEKMIFLKLLSQHYGERGEAILLKAEERLRNSLISQYQTLFSKIGRIEGGVKFLVDMRADILTHLPSVSCDKEVAHMRTLNTTIRDLLALWFSVGFLKLRRITWESPCDMVQKVSDYEAVHPIRNWTDLKRRVGPYRRCFSIITSQPAAVKQDENSYNADMDSSSEDPLRITTAFSSLSPIPGFRDWLMGEINRSLHAEASGESLDRPLLLESEITGLKAVMEQETSNVLELFKGVLSTTNWVTNQVLCTEMKNPLMRLCARYLYIEKRRGYALNSVANFHLGNGAVMWRINWLADTSMRGLNQSCGMMVNYRYFLDNTMENSRRYLETHYIEAPEELIIYLDKKSNNFKYKYDEVYMDMYTCISV